MFALSEQYGEPWCVRRLSRYNPTLWARLLGHNIHLLSLSAAPEQEEAVCMCII